MRRSGWWIGAVTGLVAGPVIGFSCQAWQESREASDVDARRAADAYQVDVPAPADAIRQLLAQDSAVVVDPLLEDRLPEEDRQRAEEVLAGSPVPARIAYLSYPSTSDAGYTPSGAGPQWWIGVGEEGHYVVLWDNGSTDTGAVGLEPELVEVRTEGQPGPALVRIAEEMTTWEAVPAADEPYQPSDFDYWGGVGGGIAAASLFGVFLVLPAFLVLRWFVGTRRRKVT